MKTHRATCTVVAALFVAGTAAIASGKKEDAQKSYTAAVPVIDSLVNKQIVHRNKAARHKSRLAARIRGMSS